VGILWLCSYFRKCVSKYLSGLSGELCSVRECARNQQIEVTASHTKSHTAPAVRLDNPNEATGRRGSQFQLHAPPANSLAPTTVLILASGLLSCSGAGNPSSAHSTIPGTPRRGPLQHGIGACRTVTGRSIRIRILRDTRVVDEVICFQRSVNSFEL
jgi:hypothetical protein